MRKSLLLLFFIGSLSAVSMRAYAFVCCDPWGFVGQAAFIQAGVSVVRTIGTSTIQIVAALSHLFTTVEGQFGRYAIEGGKQTAYLRTMAQGQMAVKSAFYMQERAGEATENAVPAAQQDSTITNAAMLSEQGSIVRQQISRVDSNFMNNFYATKAVDASVVIQRHAPYCSNQDVQLGRCLQAAADQMQNADLSVNTIMNPGDGEYETMADEEHAAALAFVQNVVNPQPVVRPSAEQIKSQQAKTVDALLLSDQAALSIAADVLNAEVTLRTRRRSQ